MDVKVLFISIFILTSCAGYRFSESKNPFKQYGIKTVGVPTFINHSSLANVSDSFTREMTLMLSRFPGLKTYPGEADADAILVGIITSEDKLFETAKTSGRKYTTDSLESSIGDRGKFYIPNTSRIRLVLRVVLIKDPSTNERKLLESSMGGKLQSSRLIINEQFTLSGSYTRVAKGGTTPDDGRSINFTANRGILRKQVGEMALRAAETFRDTVVNAF